jgi:hypothetical protein
MREESLPYDPDVLAGFPGARAYERGADRTAYLAERAGASYLIVVPDAPTGPVTVLAFDDEFERATHLTTRARLDQLPLTT